MKPSKNKSGSCERTASIAVLSSGVYDAFNEAVASLKLLDLIGLPFRVYQASGTTAKSS